MQYVSLFSRPNFKPRRRQLSRRCALRSGRPSTTTRASSRATASSDTSRSACASPGASSTRSVSRPTGRSPPQFVPLSQTELRGANLRELLFGGDRSGVVCPKVCPMFEVFTPRNGNRPTTVGIYYLICRCLFLTKSKCRAFYCMKVVQ